MLDIEKIISPLVKTQFPEFYQTEGPMFVDFVKQYYVWMESQNQTINQSRSLFDYRDIDKTLPDFISHFKNKYINGLPLNTTSNTQLTLKHSTDLYNTKGTHKGVETLLRAMYNEQVEVYFPSADLLKASDGVWNKPIYLELSDAPKTFSFIGKQVVGERTGATAFVESIIKKRVNGRIIFVAFLSNLLGDFQTGETITLTTDKVSLDCPIVVGSLSSLTVVSGGANFAVGDIFDIQTGTGTKGRARVTDVSNETGKVTFIFINSLTTGGWGYSVDDSVVYVAQKMIQVSNVTNANTTQYALGYPTEQATFQQFETVNQQFANIVYSTARPNNASFQVGALIENYYSNGVVAANATIVSTGTTNTTSGYIVISPGTGNVAVSDTVFAIKYPGAVVTATFNANSGVANSTETITTTSAHTFVNNDIVIYSLSTGNTGLSGLSVGAAYYIINANTTTLKLSDTLGGSAINLTAGLNQTGHTLRKSLGSAVITTYVDRTASGFTIGANNQYVGVINVSASGFLSTPYSVIRGVLSNTTATVANTSTGTGATFSINLITDTESVFLSPDFISSNNTQNVKFYSINLNGNNSGAALQYANSRILSTGDTAYGGLGFVKFPTCSMDSLLLDVLRYEAQTIGSIASLSGLNPGVDYNVDPFVVVSNPYVQGYDNHDYLMQVLMTSGQFIAGEQVQQSITGTAKQLTITGFSGTAANLIATTTVLLNEKIYQTYANGTVFAYGFVSEAGITGGSGTVKLTDVVGTFVNTSNASTVMRSLSSGGTANISLIQTITTATTARAIVKSANVIIPATSTNPYNSGQGWGGYGGWGGWGRYGGGGPGGSGGEGW